MNRTTIEILRFKWKPYSVRLLVAALHDAGPVSAEVWSRRAGIPRNHVLDAIREAERLGGLRSETRVEGLCLWVQPVSQWRVTSLWEHEDWKTAWNSRTGHQVRLPLRTEEPGLPEAMAVNRNPVIAPESGNNTGIRIDHRNPDVPRSDRDRVIIEKERSISRSDRDRVNTGDRDYVLAKLARIPRLQAEVLRPADEYQRRISRMFWQAESRDPEWLRATLGDLADNTSITNKAAWFNRACTTRIVNPCHR